ncbi:MAG: hypothetical protein IT236_05225 [Bacteroidia bacterium]|nr:hypothetical protein [Bacteroidia bacterium]
MLKSTQITLVAIFGLAIAACHHSKKSQATAPVVSSEPSANNNTPPAPSGTVAPPSYLYVNPFTAVYTPGEKELTALKSYYKDATMEELNEGHSIYTAGNCTKCHGPFDIYKIQAGNWKSILTDMARRANLSEANAEAVNKYFIAIKATQPK